MVAAAIVGSAAIGAVATGLSAGGASSSQSDAANASIAAQERQQAQTRADLLPYNTAGQGAVSQLTDLTGTGPGGNPLTAPLTKPIVMDQAALEQTPGYQFNLEQGLKAVQNSAAARGLGVSGAALKGAATYATGLADNTYQNQFNNAVTNQTNTYNKLMGISSLGESAAAQTGALGTQTAANIGNSLTGIGNAQAAASIATGQGISNAAGSVGQGLLLNKLLQNGSQTGIFGNDAGGGTALSAFA